MPLQLDAQVYEELMINSHNTYEYSFTTTSFIS